MKPEDEALYIATLGILANEIDPNIDETLKKLLNEKETNNKGGKDETKNKKQNKQKGD